MSVMLNLYIWGGGGLSDQVNVVFNFVTVGPDNNYHSELWTCLQGLKKGICSKFHWVKWLLFNVVMLTSDYCKTVSKL